MLVKWKWRDTEEPFEVELLDHEYESLAEMRRRMRALPEGSRERVEMFNSMCTFMEMKVALGAREVTPDEMEARGLSFELLSPEEQHVPLSNEARTETLALMEKMEGDGFKIPEKAKRLMAEGQTSLLAEASHEPARMPYRDADEDLPEPEPIREAHARSSDPWTSHAAARSISPDEMRETQMAVLDCLRRSGGALHHEALVEAYEKMRGDFGWPQQSVSGLRTRMSELVQMAVVRDSGRTVQLPSKRSSIVWEAVAQ